MCANQTSVVENLHSGAHANEATAPRLPVIAQRCQLHPPVHPASLKECSTRGVASYRVRRQRGSLGSARTESNKFAQLTQSLQRPFTSLGRSESRSQDASRGSTPTLKLGQYQTTTTMHPSAPSRPKVASTGRRRGNSLALQPLQPLPVTYSKKLTTRSDSNGLGLDRAIRRASLVCRSVLDRVSPSTNAATYFRLQKRSAFGLYSFEEVMAVIRLFHLMDQDDSNSVSLTELSHIQSFFKKTGHQDLSTSFDVIDEDGNGQISLHELLQCCFPLATVQQLDEMLKLAKAGSITKYVNGQVSDPVADQSESSLPLDELTEMFRLFDVNGDGYVTMEEAMSAVRAKGPDSAGYEPKFAECSSWRWSSGLTREDIESCFAEYDSNGDKVLDFAEFVQLMRISYQP